MGGLALQYLTKYWQAALIAVLLASGIAMFKARDRALVERGQAIEQARLADSVLTTTRASLARVDTLYRRDTLRFVTLRSRVDTLRDTVLTHLTDTLLVKEFIAREDSTIHACTEALGDCAKFRTIAEQRFAAYEVKLKAQPIAASHSCVVSNVLWSALGIGAGRLSASLHR